MGSQNKRGNMQPAADTADQLRPKASSLSHSDVPSKCPLARGLHLALDIAHRHACWLALSGSGVAIALGTVNWLRFLDFLNSADSGFGPTTTSFGHLLLPMVLLPIGIVLLLVSANLAATSRRLAPLCIGTAGAICGTILSIVYWAQPRAFFNGDTLDGDATKIYWGQIVAATGIIISSTLLISTVRMIRYRLSSNTNEASPLDSRSSTKRSSLTVVAFLVLYLPMCLFLSMLLPDHFWGKWSWKHGGAWTPLANLSACGVSNCLMELNCSFGRMSHSTMASYTWCPCVGCCLSGVQSCDSCCTRSYGSPCRLAAPPKPLIRTNLSLLSSTPTHSSRRKRRGAICQGGVFWSDLLLAHARWWWRSACWLACSPRSGTPISTRAPIQPDRMLKFGHGHSGSCQTCCSRCCRCQQPETRSGALSSVFRGKMASGCTYGSATLCWQCLLAIWVYGGKCLTNRTISLRTAKMEDSHMISLRSAQLTTRTIGPSARWCSSGL